MLKRIFIGLVSLLALQSLAGCATVGTHGATNSPHPELVVRNYIAALNRRDLLALTAYVTPDVEWYSMVGADRVTEVAGREALIESLKQYFAQNAKTRWTILSVQAVDNRAAVADRSEWGDANGTQTREGLGVYECVDGRIKRITYFLNGG